MTLFIDIDNPAHNVFFWRICETRPTPENPDDYDVISEGQTATEDEAVQEANEELSYLQYRESWEM